MDSVFFFPFSESEVKDVCLSVANNSCVTSQNGNEDAVAAVAAVQNKPGKAQQNQRQSNQNHRYQRPPVVTDEEYSDSSGGLYNDYVSNNSVSVLTRERPYSINIISAVPILFLSRRGVSFTRTRLKGRLARHRIYTIYNIQHVCQILLSNYYVTIWSVINHVSRAIGHIYSKTQYR